MLVQWLLYIVSVSVMCVFFFQAEDGIRDLVRSRGLGDVYKRQMYYRRVATVYDELFKSGRVLEWYDSYYQKSADTINQDLAKWSGDKSAPVSYTHLTLPTSDLV